MSGRVVVLAALLVTGTAVGAASGTAEPGASSDLPKAAAAARARTLFSCRLPGGKIATVTGSDGRIVYRYGSAKRAELTIEGTAARKNLFQRIAVHGGDWDVQLRFVRGDYSYIVHSFPRNDIVDNVAVSGLVVFRGAKRILDRSCAPWAEISFGDLNVLDWVPESPERAPSAWGD